MTEKEYFHRHNRWRSTFTEMDERHLDATAEDMWYSFVEANGWLTYVMDEATAVLEALIIIMNKQKLLVKEVP